MQYTAVNLSGTPLTTTTAHTLAEAKVKFEHMDCLLFLKYRIDYKIITGYSVQQKIEKGILKACFWGIK